MSPDYDFRVQFTDDEGASCEQALRISVVVPLVGLHWNNLVWGAVQQIQGTPTGSFAGANWSTHSEATDIGRCTGSMTYNGPAVACTLSTHQVGVNGGFSFTITQNGNPIVVTPVGIPPDIVWDFTVADTGGNLQTLAVQVDWDSVGFPGDQYDVTGVFAPA